MGYNNYSWNLGPEEDYIEHKATGKAHYSKNWDKAKQDAYNAAYYLKNKAQILANRAKAAGKQVKDAADKKVAEEKANYNKWYDNNDRENINNYDSARKDKETADAKSSMYRKYENGERSEAIKNNHGSPLPGKSGKKEMQKNNRATAKYHNKKARDYAQQAKRAENQSNSAQRRMDNAKRKHEEGRGSARSIVDYATRNARDTFSSTARKAKKAYSDFDKKHTIVENTPGLKHPKDSLSEAKRQVTRLKNKATNEINKAKHNLKDNQHTKRKSENPVVKEAKRQANRVKNKALNTLHDAEHKIEYKQSGKVTYNTKNRRRNIINNTKNSVKNASDSMRKRAKSTMDKLRDSDYHFTKEEFANWANKYNAEQARKKTNTQRKKTNTPKKSKVRKA